MENVIKQDSLSYATSALRAGLFPAKALRFFALSFNYECTNLEVVVFFPFPWLIFDLRVYVDV